MLSPFDPNFTPTDHLDLSLRAVLADPQTIIVPWDGEASSFLRVDPANPGSFDALCRALWDTHRGDPDVLVLSSDLMDPLADALLGPEAPCYILRDGERLSGRGFRISRLTNKVTGATVDVIYRPDLAPHAAYLLTNRSKDFSSIAHPHGVALSGTRDLAPTREVPDAQP